MPNFQQYLTLTAITCCLYQLSYAEDTPTNATQLSLKDGNVTAIASYQLPIQQEYHYPSTTLVTAGPQTFSLSGDSDNSSAMTGYLKEGKWQFATSHLPTYADRYGEGNFFPFFPVTGAQPSALVLGDNSTFSVFDGSNWTSTQQVDKIPSTHWINGTLCRNGVCIAASDDNQHLLAFTYTADKAERVIVTDTHYASEPSKIISYTYFDNQFYLLTAKEDGTPALYASQNGTLWTPSLQAPTGITVSDGSPFSEDSTTLNSDGNTLVLNHPGCKDPANCPSLYYLTTTNRFWHAVKPNSNINLSDYSLVIRNGFIWIGGACPDAVVNTRIGATDSQALQSKPQGICHYRPDFSAASDHVGTKLFTLKDKTQFFYASPTDSSYHLLTDALPDQVFIDSYQYLGDDTDTGAANLLATGRDYSRDYDTRYVTLLHNKDGWKVISTSQEEADSGSYLSIDAAAIEQTNTSNLWETYTQDAVDPEN